MNVRICDPITGPIPTATNGFINCIYPSKPDGDSLRPTLNVGVVV